MNWQIAVGPVITPGLALLIVVMLKDLSPLELQFETDLTLRGDVVKLAAKLTTILVVPCPLIKVIPVGIVHKYDVAYCTAAIE